MTPAERKLLGVLAFILRDVQLPWQHRLLLNDALLGMQREVVIDLAPTVHPDPDAEQPKG
jgi:hypothetical protein